MSESNSAHQGFWRSSEFILIVLGLVGWALHWVWPLVLPWGEAPNLWPWRVGVGVALILGGYGLVEYTVRSLARYQQPTGPGKPTTQLVTKGIFEFSRNPLYLACIPMLAGVGVAFNNSWILLLLPVEVVFFNIWMIWPEEAYLKEQFGEEYQNYCSKVRRWL